MKKLLPTHYFLLTIALPQGLRDVVRSYQKESYGALFACTNEALKKLAQDTRFIGSDRIGYLAALHTWGGMLQYHPHLHLIIPGGALSDHNEQWLSCRQDLFVRTKLLEIIFKAKFKDAMKKAGLLHKINHAVWKQQWVIDSQAVGRDKTPCVIFQDMCSGLPSPTIVSKALKIMSLNFYTKTVKRKNGKSWPFLPWSLSGDSCSMFFPKDL